MPKACTRDGKSFLGSTVPTASTYWLTQSGRSALRVAASRGRSLGPVEPIGHTPGWTTRTRSGLAPRDATTSCATELVWVCTHAPRPRAFLTSSGYARARRQAQLGEPQRGQVVYGHDRCGPPRRRDHEVGPVHDIGPADEELRRREGPVRPGLAERPRRHRPVMHGNPGRDLRGNGVPAPTAHGVGTHGKVGPSWQALAKPPHKTRPPRSWARAKAWHRRPRGAGPLQGAMPRSPPQVGTVSPSRGTPVGRRHGATTWARPHAWPRSGRNPPAGARFA